MPIMGLQLICWLWDSGWYITLRVPVVCVAQNGDSITRLCHTMGGNIYEWSDSTFEFTKITMSPKKELDKGAIVGISPISLLRMNSTETDVV